MYKIIQVLNNNAAIIRLPNQTKAIAMGRGLVFGKHKGDSINSANINQIFELKNKEFEKDFSVLLKDVPIDFIVLAYEVIDKGINNYNYLVEEYIYITLPNHIYSNFLRLKKGIYENGKIPSLEKEYPIEYKISHDAVNLINNKLGVRFPFDEVNSIALHFINAKKSEIKNIDIVAQKRLKVTSAVRLLLKKAKIIRKKENSSIYDRLMIHIIFFVDRIYSEKSENVQLPQKFVKELLNRYPIAYKLALQIKGILEAEVNTDDNLTDNEIFYLTIHLQRLLSEEE